MSLPLITQPPKIGCGDPGEPIDFSGRFDGGQGLERTFAYDNKSKWALSFWAKLVSEDAILFSAAPVGSANPINGTFLFSGGGYVRVRNAAVSATPYDYSSTSRYLRDFAAWAHLFYRWDDNEPLALSRYLAINGVAQSITNQAGTDNLFGAVRHFIGGHVPANGGASMPSLKAYLADYHGLADQDVTEHDFGYFNSDGHWVPKAYAGKGQGSSTYGPNGFHFDFADPLDLGKDVSGNGNHFASFGLTPDNQSTDTPSNNQSNLSPLANGSTNLEKGNSEINAIVNGSSNEAISTIAISANAKGRWTCDYKLSVFGDVDDGRGADVRCLSTGALYGFSTNAAQQISIWPGNTNTGLILNTDTVITFTIDFDTDKIELRRDNVLFHTFDDVNLAQGVWVFRPYAVRQASRSPARIVASFNPVVDEEWDIKRLSCPEILNPDDYFTIRQQSNGDDVTDLPWNPQSIKSMVLSKRRDSLGNWRIVDTLRGASKWWSFNGTAIEQTDNDGLTAFTVNGYSIGADADYQGNRVDYIWRAGPKSGFDIVQLNHVNGTPTTVPHQCGDAVEYGWVFNATAGGDRRVYHKDFPTGQYLRLNSTAAAGSDAGWFTSTANDLTLGANLPTGTYYIYVWRSVPSFSTFTKYKGTGTTDGAFVAMDFQPRFTSIFRPGAASNHHISDADRDEGNPVKKYHNMEATSGEGSTTRDMDFVSNGLKLRASTADINANGSDYVIAAWAKAPFKFARAQ